MDTSEKILIGLKDLLIEEGPSGLSIRNIAKKAGVNHGLVHHYFGSKENLMSEMLKRETDLVLSRIQGRLTEEANPQYVAKAFIEEMIYHPEFGKILPQIIPLALNYPILKTTLAEILHSRRGFLKEKLGIKNSSEILLVQASLLGLRLIGLMDEKLDIERTLIQLFETFLPHTSAS